jgi:gluconate kinase
MWWRDSLLSYQRRSGGTFLNVDVMAQRFELGLDLWTGEPLTDRDRRDWEKLQKQLEDFLLFEDYNEVQISFVNCEHEGERN